MKGQRRGSSSSDDDLTPDELILTRDWAKLRTLQLRADPLPPIPAGAIGKVLKTGPEAALVRFRHFGPTNVRYDDLERASKIDLLPVAAQPLVRRLGVWVLGGIGAIIFLVAGGFIEKWVGIGK